ncbi:nucleoside/nucleotide kinase family protein [Sulfitobacter sp. LCG007]
MDLSPPLEEITARIMVSGRRGARRVVALAGPPASGKSTLAEVLAGRLTLSGCPAQVVPMDGFHLDDRVLEARGLLSRKGAPETFDLDGFTVLAARLSEAREVVYPVFDRTREIAIAGAGFVPAACDTVVVEGNYLLFDSPGWRDLGRFWDVSIRLEADIEVLRARLMERWTGFGLSLEQSRAKAEGNDLPNAELVLSNPTPADIICASVATRADAP